jgi:hypothetical protein
LRIADVGVIRLLRYRVILELNKLPALFFREFSEGVLQGRLEKRRVCDVIG